RDPFTGTVPRRAERPGPGARDPARPLRLRPASPRAPAEERGGVVLSGGVDLQWDAGIAVSGKGAPRYRAPGFRFGRKSSSYTSHGGSGATRLPTSDRA